MTTRITIASALVLVGVAHAQPQPDVAEFEGDGYELTRRGTEWSGGIDPYFSLTGATDPATGQIRLVLVVEDEGTETTSRTECNGTLDPAGRELQIRCPGESMTLRRRGAPAAGAPGPGAPAAGAPPAGTPGPREVRLDHRQVIPDTGGDENGEFHDAVVDWQFTVRATTGGVAMTSAARPNAAAGSPTDCASRGRADLHPAPGEEEVFVCPDGFGIVALRAADGTLVWADFATSPGHSPSDGWSEVLLSDLTADGRAELALSGEYEFSPTEGSAWRLVVVTFEAAGRREILSSTDVDAVMAGGDRPAHSVTVRAAAARRPVALVHVQTAGRRRTQEAFAYDPGSRQLRLEGPGGRIRQGR